MATTWRYLLGGRVLHEIGSAYARISYCGVTVMNFSDWRGTGSQAEYDKAATLPKCGNCLKGLEHAEPMP